MSYALGFDLGGTHVKWVAVTPKGRLLNKGTFTTKDDPSHRRAPTFALWAGAIRDHLNEYADKAGEPPSAVGIAAPGLAATDSRSIAHMPGRLAGLEGLDWTDFLESDNLVPVLNDAHAALLGEVWKGAAKGLKHVVLLTLGTGVGGAAMEGGRLLKGCIGRAGHHGHLCLNPLGPPDVTGTPGSLEDAIGECTVETRTHGRFSSTQALVEAHRAGDQEATVVWLASIYCLACGVTSLVNILDPEAVVIGGGISAAGADLFEPLDDLLNRVEWRPGGHRVRVLPAKLGSYAGALGAARNAIISTKKETP
ncbi:MAG: ROK family protein [Candidatus Omnitrophica bacterium]|nr:Beta-glucoside kinase [bacterium]NUN94802.1 ROK family protein [Candidatus Omnitrophota bacterium]